MIAPVKGLIWLMMRLAVRQSRSGGAHSAPYSFYRRNFGRMRNKNASAVEPEAPSLTVWCAGHTLRLLVVARSRAGLCGGAGGEEAGGDDLGRHLFCDFGRIDGGNLGGDECFDTQ